MSALAIGVTINIITFKITFANEDVFTDVTSVFGKGDYYVIFQV